MFGRKQDLEQYGKVAELLTSWSKAITRIDSATDTRIISFDTISPWGKCLWTITNVYETSKRD